MGLAAAGCPRQAPRSRPCITPTLHAPPSLPPTHLPAQTFKVDLANTQEIMASAAGQEVARRGLVMAGESGIFTPADVALVQGAGCGAILVGESLVKQGDPAAGVKALLELA